MKKPTWWQRLLRIRYERGSYFEFEPVGEATALRALEGALADDGQFSISSEFGAKMDFYLRKDKGDIWIDCWFFESELDEVVLSREAAHRLVQLLFTNAGEREVLRWLRREGAALVPEEVAV